ncbi:MAG TPA: two-component regulator propeller domain-containing protein [Pyrinomonadaceae bacterium]|nr:two-component regulator propeller domain-containing protein [Pyrinomonadaceae bacterium]
MNEAKKTSLVVAALGVLVFAVSIHVFAQNESASRLLRSHFADEQGLTHVVVNEITQTHDGFLWLITNGINLVRYDGKDFYVFDRLQAKTAAVAPDGDLWVGTRSDGLIRIPSAHLNRFTLAGAESYHPGPGPASQIVLLRFSKNGVLWVGTNDGLFRYEKGQFVAVGPRTLRTRQINETPDGHILVVTETGLLEIAGSEVVDHPQLTEKLGVKGSEIYDVLKDHQGVTWYLTALGVARETNGHIEKLGTYARNGHAALRAHEDEKGAIWIGKEEGLFRATSTGLELIAEKMQVRTFLSDRDGQLWIGTNGDALHRFKESPVRMLTMADGLPGDVIMTVLAARDGTVWTGANCGGIARYDGKHFQTFNEKDGLLNGCVFALAEDANGDLWIGTWGGGAFHYHNGTFTQYSKAQGLADVVKDIVVAQDGSVWFGTLSGVSHLKDARIRTYTTADGLPTNAVARVFQDRAGVIWVGMRQGLYRMVGDRFENVSSLPKALAIPFAGDRDGGFYIGVDDNPDQFTRRVGNGGDADFKEFLAYDMVQTDDGEFWFAGSSIHRVPPGKLTLARKHDEPLDFATFSAADGLTAPASAVVQHNLALTSNGEIWAATTKGVAIFDLRRFPIIQTTPSIYLKDLTIGRNTQHPDQGIVLPPGTNHCQINFGVIEVASPEKIRMQYRLDGVDTEWLDAGTDPHAIYTNIPVGAHLLHIRACNRNGIWDRQGVVFTITQKPFFYQTRWFVAAMIGLGILLVWLIHHLRVAQVSRQMSARFDERLAERTRVARELHDTLLQTVQGSKMLADHALKNSADHTRVVRSVEQLSTWLAQATEEGRAALRSLRASTTETNNLAESFRRAIDECCNRDNVRVSFTVNGDSSELHPVVRDEVYRIGYEAIRNSCTHSGSDHLDVTLEYGHDLTLRISDNGAGIDAEVMNKGKEGHFGLRGMRERAERIGSKFNLTSAPGSGTVITLVVPGRIAFRSARRAWPRRLVQLWQRSSS